MFFRDRSDAGRRLAEALAGRQPSHPLILAVPRGGVAVARVIADELGWPLDVVLPRKLGAPGNSELAIGAVAEGGGLYLDRRSISLLGVDSRYIEDEKKRQMAVIAERRAGLQKYMKPAERLGRDIFLVDDGIATGSTMRAAARSIIGSAPASLTIVVPVAPADTLDALSDCSDEIVCLSSPAEFMAVGQFYESFDQVSEEEMRELLAGAGGPKP